MKILPIFSYLVFTLLTSSIALLSYGVRHETPDVIVSSIEDFEDEITGNSSFIEGSSSFDATGGLTIAFFSTFTNYIENSSGGGGSIGSFDITTVDAAFRVNSLDIWTSDNNASNHLGGDVTFRGTPAGGGPSIDVLMSLNPPLNDPGNTFNTVSFAGTALDGVDLESLEFILSDGLEYAAIDNFNFTEVSTAVAGFSVTDVSMAEGDMGTKVFDFTVSRNSNTQANAITVQTADNTANAGTDYIAAGPIVLNFPASGTNSQTFSVTVFGDVDEEPNEIFFVNLSNPTGGAVILDGQGIGTIEDDDLVCETFEDETDNATSFSEAGASFSATGELMIGFFATGGSQGSDYYLESDPANTPHNGSVGSISLDGPSNFIAKGLDLYFSNDGDINTSEAGTVDFVGSLLAGGTATASLTTNAGFLYTTLSFSGTSLDGQILTSLEVVLPGSGNNYVAIDNFKFIESFVAPEMLVEDSDGTEIQNGDNTPSTSESTDFGAVNIDGGIATQTYTIANTGDANLSLTGNPAVSISGSSAFSVSMQPGSTSITPSNSTSFQVTYDPGSTDCTDPQTAVISIDNNDSDENPYTFTVQGTPVDNVDPTANCPSTQTVNNDAGQCEANVSFTIPDPTDNCSATSTASPASGSFFDVGTTQVTVTATDGAGNSDQCTFDVVVEDNEDPQIACPANITVNSDPGQSSAVVTIPDPNILDNCTGASFEYAPASGSTFNVGITTVTATVTDGASNTNQCTFSVTVDACPFASATVIYVDQDATTGNNNGTSWTDAFIDLQIAMDAAVSCGLDSIWVAEGTYLPTESPGGGTTGRNRTFHLDQDLKIFGGFGGTETQFNQRDVQANPTVLSGDFDSDDNFDAQNGGYQNSSGDDNAFHVFITANLTNNAELDGFSLRGGNASGSGSTSYGGRSFFRNRGGGMANESSSPTITNCSIFGNAALSRGGGMAIRNGSNPTITNCSFTTNTAKRGGGMANESSSPTITNCTFFGNVAERQGQGGGISNEFSSPTITNCIFWDNGDEIDGAVPITHCIVQSGYGACTNCPGTDGNADPLFVDATNPTGPDGIFRTADDGLALLPCSPAIDAGTATGAPALDILGNARVNGDGQNGAEHDIGAYEYQTVGGYGTRIYVDIDASGNNNGTSWTDAFKDLQTAMDIAITCSIDSIWVAEGTYLPTSSPDEVSTNTRDRAFHLDQDLKIFGGFGGTETQFNQRDVQANPTVLSGDFNSDDDFDAQNGGYQSGTGSDNAYHVFITANLGSGAELDGFRIRGGNASGSGSITYGTRAFLRSSGGGMYNRDGSPTVTNCTFSGNTAIPGGGMFNESSSPTVTNCTFSGNTARTGGMYNKSSDPTVTNCTFSGNTAIDGGGMYNESSDPTVTNCTFSGNMATRDGGGMFNNTSSPTVTNCILWGNGSGDEIDGGLATVSYSIVQGGYGACTNCPGTDGNADPLFVDATNPAGPDGIFRTADDGLALLPCSPAIDAGTNNNAPTTDILGNARPLDGNGDATETTDIGAYEYRGTPAQVVANCQEQTVQLDVAGDGSLAVADLNDGSTGCGILSFTVNDLTTLDFTCANVGNNQVILTVSDERSQIATCTTNVTVEDNVDPVANCPTTQTVNNTTGECGANVDFTIPDPTDNCSATSTASPASGTFFNVGTTQVTVTATDGAGNTNQCTFDVVVNDTEDPVANCPGTQTVSNTTGECGANVDFTIPDPTDNCSATSTASPASGTFFNVGTTQVTVTATDGAGNTNQCTFNVVVNDTENPTVSCPGNVSQPVDMGQTYATVNNIAPTASNDNCSVTGTTYAITGAATATGNDDASGTQFNIGTSTVTYTVTDAAGNSGACSFNVNIDGDAEIDLQDPNNNSLTSSVSNYDFGNVNIDGGSASGTFTINNLGDINLSLSGNPDAVAISGSASFSVTQPAATTIAPAGSTTFQVAYNPANGDCSEQTATISIANNDPDENPFTFTVTVTPVDNVNPVANCPATQTVNNTTGECGANVNFTIPDPTDNCSATSTASPASGSFFNVGTTQVTVTATDGAGNSNQCIFDVVVNDTEDPVANCPATQTVNNTTGECGANVDFTIPDPTDNCSATSTASPASGTLFAVGTTQVTVTATDGAGNSNQCTFDVVVNDTEDPTAVCQDTTLALSLDGMATVTAFELADQSSDACGISMYQSDLGSFDCADLGEQTVTVTITDNNSNINTCQSTVTVVDPTVPEPYFLEYLDVDYSRMDVCGTTFQLFGEEPIPSIPIYMGMWSFISNPGNTGSLDDPSNPRATLTGVWGGTYELAWTITGACETYQIMVTIGFSPDADLPGGLPDGTQDCSDLCLGGDDRINTDGVGIPDECDCAPESIDNEFVEVSFIATPGETVIADFQINTAVALDAATYTGPVRLQAGNTVVLEPGFHAMPGVDFRAYIEYCNDPLVPLLAKEQEQPATAQPAVPIPAQRVSTEELTLLVIPTIAESEAMIRIQNSVAQPVTLLVFNQNGQLVRTLLDQEAMAAGRYEYQLQLGNFQAGMYYVKLIGANSMQTKRLIVVRR